jgi:2-oxoglutarate ferredoxin oxidoreductase subunit alpha
MRFTADPIVHRRLVERLVGKINKNTEKIAEFEVYNVDACEIGIISYGSTSRAVYETVELARERGVTLGYIRLKTLWPFPATIIQTMAQNAKTIIVPEMNLRQIFYETERVVRGRLPVLPINKIGGGELITPEELLGEVTRLVKNLD